MGTPILVKEVTPCPWETLTTVQSRPSSLGPTPFLRPRGQSSVKAGSVGATHCGRLQQQMVLSHREWGGPAWGHPRSQRSLSLCLQTPLTSRKRQSGASPGRNGTVGQSRCWASEADPREAPL